MVTFLSIRCCHNLCAIGALFVALNVGCDSWGGVFSKEKGSEFEFVSRHPSAFGAGFTAALVFPFLSDFSNEIDGYDTFSFVGKFLFLHVAVETVTAGAKAFYARRRPFYESSVYFPGREDARRSFFSGHAAHYSAVVAGSVCFLQSYLGRGSVFYVASSIMYMGAAHVAMARFLDKQHYLSDIYVGTLIGVGFANLLCLAK